jgi:CRISPR-associated protein Cas1
MAKNHTQYIFSMGELKRKDNSLLLITDENKKVIPVETVEEILIFSEVNINKRLLEFLTQKHIPVHFFNYYEYYIGSYYPRDYMNSGLITLKQAQYYIQHENRLYLAQSFVSAAISNMIFVLRVYKSRDVNLSDDIDKLQEYLKLIKKQQNINQLMAIEGNAREAYYKTFDKIINQDDFIFEKRTKRPPENKLNTLISFGNSLLYVTVLSEIYRTHLDPRIGFLHETNERSFSLNLDIAEIFKPIIVDRVIFSLLNRHELSKNDFEQNFGGLYLKEKGRNKFLKSYDQRLKQTIMHNKLKRKVSYRRLIRLECYKLYKHFLGEESYQPFIKTR